MVGTDDLFACFVAGNCLNWNGDYLAETEARHDEVNSCVDVLLNFGGFMYIGAILPWSSFQDSAGSGLTYGRLIALGVMVLLFRRIPAIYMTYKFMPKVCQDWKEALFMGYFGPIGIGAVFYVEHTRHLYPETGEALTDEENYLTQLMVPVVYWLVFFSIVVHGLSIPALNIFLKYRGVKPITDHEGPVEMRVLSRRQSLPKNSRASLDPRRNSIVVNNRFSRASQSTSQTSHPDLARQYSRDVQTADDDMGAKLTKAVSEGSQVPWDRSIRFHEPQSSPRPDVRPNDMV